MAVRPSPSRARAAAAAAAAAAVTGAAIAILAALPAAPASANSGFAEPESTTTVNAHPGTCLEIADRCPDAGAPARRWPGATKRLPDANKAWITGIKPF